MVYFHVAVIWKEKKSFRVAKGYRCFLCDLKFNASFDACDISMEKRKFYASSIQGIEVLLDLWQVQVLLVLWFRL